MSPQISADGDVIFVDVPADYGDPYGAFVRFVRNHLPGVWIDWTAVKEAYRFGRGRPFPVGRRRSEAAADEKAKVRFSEDGLTAYLILYAPKPQGKRLTEPELLRLIRAYGVPPHLLDSQQFRLAFLRRTYGEPETIARGTPAVDGASASIAWDEGLPSDTGGFLEAVNAPSAPYPSTILAAVRAGQTVGRFTRPGEGTAGLSVAGMVIAPRRGSDPTHLGEGLELLEDGSSVRANADGHLRISGAGGTTARVFPLFVARSAQDLEPWAGGIVPGSVVVEGDLDIRFPLRILGDAEIRGGLVRSDLEVMGSLFVRDGVINHGRAPVRVGGLLSAGFLDRATVMAETVHVRRYSLQSRIVAFRAITALGSGVSLAGGQVHASVSIDAEALGSPNAMETEIGVALPAIANAFQTLYQSWATALAEAAAPDEADGRELKAAASRWHSAAQAVPLPDLGSVKIFAKKVHSAVGIRVGSALREIGSAFGPVTFTYEKIGERDRVAMARN
ncbi:MAG: DUF342 domain-containing protein [Deltaproteobacteria bacterium]|nr:DUF342 domain-containing protein [Deltaproteobacteria bacterium]